MQYEETEQGTEQEMARMMALSDQEFKTTITNKLRALTSFRNWTDKLWYIQTSRILKWSEVKVAQLCLTLGDPMDYTVHGILQARILESVAFPFSRGSSQPRDRIQLSQVAGGFFTIWAAKEAQEYQRG